MSKLTQEQIQANKTEFINLLRSTGRENIENLILWLDTKSDFFTAPSSSKYHGCIEGGLCQHSLNVYKAAQAELENIKKLGKVDINISSISDDNISYFIAASSDPFFLGSFIPEPVVLTNL